MFVAANELLYGIAERDDQKGAGTTVPRYLFTAGGRAYHATALHRDNAISLYSRAAEGPLTGQQWLAAKLAEEQQELGNYTAERRGTSFPTWDGSLSGG